MKAPSIYFFFFIERDELDINDIPISKITDDFLGYIHQLEDLNIDVASEFILVAAKLMRIKARLLLPRKVYDAEGNEMDPRKDLVQKLLEYKKYKSVLDEMRALEELRSKKEFRGNLTKEIRSIATRALVDVEMESLSLFKLLKVFEQVMDKYELEKSKPKHQILKYEYTIDKQSDFILQKLNKTKKINFIELFDSMENRIHAIVTFLSLLELLNSQSLQIRQGEGINNFWLYI